MRMSIRCRRGQGADADQGHDRAAGQNRHGYSRGGRSGCRGTREDCRPDRNGGGVPFCSRGEQRDDRGGLRRLPAAPARGPHGSDGGTPCLCGCESIGYPDGQAAGARLGGAVRACWRALAPLTLAPVTPPSVGRLMPPDGLSDAGLLSYPGDRGLGGRDCGSSQESGRHARPDDLGDLPGRLG